MSFSQPKQFWTWFRRNSNTLLQIPHMDKEDKEYWIREISTHLRAYTKKLYCFIIWYTDKSPQFIITTEVNPAYYNMAEKFVAKVGEIPGWELLALRPPGLFPHEMIQEKALALGIDLDKCGFEYPGEYEGRLLLVIYAELYTEITEKMEWFMEEVILNILGERVFGLAIEAMTLESKFERPEEDREFALFPLSDLPIFVENKDISMVAINEKGEITNL